MQNRVQEVYDQVRMPEECSRRIEQAMRSKKTGVLKPFTGYRRVSRIAVALTGVLLFLLTNVTVYAYTGKGIIGRFVSFADNAIFTKGRDENGNNISTAALDTADATAPAEFREGRLWFTANGENIDITNQVSENNAFIYDYRDGEGITHYLIVGGAPETFGYAEFLYDETQMPEWIGGYFTAGKVGETINPDWLEKAKKELGIPWP